MVETIKNCKHYFIDTWELFCHLKRQDNSHQLLENFMLFIAVKLRTKKI